MTSSIQYLNVDRAAKNWRDLTPKEAKRERRERILAVVMGILVGGTFALAAAGCLIAGQGFSSAFTGDLATRLTWLGVGFAGAAVITTLAFMVFALAYNKEHEWGGNPRKYLNRASTPKFNANEVSILLNKETKVDDLYQHFYGRTRETGGGLKPAVRAGILTAAEATELRGIMRTYKGSVLPHLKKDDKDKRTDIVRGYDEDVKGKHDALKEEWQTLQAKLSIGSKNSDLVEGTDESEISESD